MRVLLVLGGLALVAVGAAVVLVMLDSEEESAGYRVVTSAEPGPARDRKPPRRRFKPQEPASKDQAAARKKQARDIDEEVSEKNVMRFGQEFEKKWHEDRKRLGEERHRQMEKLWFEGRRPRGKQESIEKLEKLIEEFPDTNRAGCAAFELGHHMIRDRRLDLDARREKAAGYWRMVEERYGDTLCEYNAHAPARSKLALATWVLRYSDPAEARRVLEEVIEKHAGETDHLGQPLDQTARRVLDRIK